MPTIIALDAMGADRAPKPEIEGAILAARYYDVEVVLVGQEEVIRAELDLHRFWRRLPISIVNAREVVGMHEKAAQAVRAKRDQAKWKAAVKQVEDTARGTGNLMPVIVEAVEANATVGEISDAMRHVYGEYHETVII